MIRTTVSHQRWVHNAACAWAVCFAAPHIWWALGSPFGFPGGQANHHLWMTSWWRCLYDVIVILLSLLGAVVALALRPPGHARLRQVFIALAWIAAGLLTLRGVAGLIVDGTSDLVWWPTFLVGGVLFGSVAWLSRTPSPRARHASVTTPVAKRITLSNELALSYVDQGDRTTPVLVLLPGLSDSWRSYELVLAHLPTSIRVIAVSLRGHGDSDKPESGYSTKDFTADVADLLSALGVTRAIVAGHSSASLVAQRFAIDYPERTAGIVLEGSFATLRGRKELVDVVASDIAPLTDPIAPDFVRKFAAGTIVRPVPQSFMDAMVEESLKVPARVWREAFAALTLDDHTSELGHIKAPTILLWGNQDELIGREEQDSLIRGIPGSRLVVYSGVGHSPHWEDPERFAADLIVFANSLERSR